MNDDLTASTLSGLEAAQREARVAQREQQKRSTLLYDRPKPLDTKGYLSEIEKIKKDVVKQEQKYKAGTVLLDSGERISKEQYALYSPEQQTQLKSLGVAKFNEWLGKQRADTITAIENRVMPLVVSESTPIVDAVLLNTGEYISKETYNSLTPEDKSLITLVGIDQFNFIRNTQAAQAYEAEMAKYVQLQTGEYLTKEDFDKFSLYDQYLLKAQGVDGFNKIKQDEFNQANLEVRPGEYINRVFYEGLPENEQGFIRTQGVEAYNAGKQAEYAESQALFNRAIQWISVDGNGNRTIDIVAAISQGGFTVEELKKLDKENITDDTIRQAYSSEPGFNTIVKEPESTIVEPQAPVSLARQGGYPITPEMEELEPYVTDRTAGGGAQYNITAYIEDKGVNAETIGVLQGVGYSAPVINAIVSLAPYKGDVIQFARENPQAATILAAAGFKPEDVNKVVESSELAPYYMDYEASYLTRQGVTAQEIELADRQEQLQRGGMAADISFGYRSPEQAEAQREAYLKIKELKNAALDEYIKEYGGESLAQSVAAMYLTPVFAAARAFRPDVEIGDISGAEWVMTGGEVLFLAAMPFGGITGGIIGKALDIGATAAFEAATAMNWNNLNTAQKVLGIGGGLANLVVPYTISRVGKMIRVANIYKNPTSRLAVEMAEKAGMATNKAQFLEGLAKISGQADDVLLSGGIAGRLQAAQANANLYMNRLTQQLSKLDKISPELLQLVETKAGINGLAKTIKDVAKNAVKLTKAQGVYGGVQGSLGIDDIRIKGKAGLAGEKSGYKLNTIQAEKIKTAKNVLSNAQRDFDLSTAKLADMLSGERFVTGSKTWEEMITKVLDDEAVRNAEQQAWTRFSQEYAWAETDAERLSRMIEKRAGEPDYMSDLGSPRRPIDKTIDEWLKESKVVLESTPDGKILTEYGNKMAVTYNDISDTMNSQKITEAFKERFPQASLESMTPAEMLEELTYSDLMPLIKAGEIDNRTAAQYVQQTISDHFPTVYPSDVTARGAGVAAISREDIIRINDLLKLRGTSAGEIKLGSSSGLVSRDGKVIAGYIPDSDVPYFGSSTGGSKTSNVGTALDNVTRLDMERQSLISSLNYYKANPYMASPAKINILQRKLDNLPSMSNITQIADIEPMIMVFGANEIKLALQPALLHSFSTKYNISSEEILGLQKLTEQQLISIANTLNIPEDVIANEIEAGTLPIAVVSQAVSILPKQEAEILAQAIVSSFPATYTEISGIPKIKEWQQVSAQIVADIEPLISAEIIQQASPAELEQIETAQQAITEINQQVAQQVAQQVSPLQAQQIEAARQVINEIATNISMRTGVTIDTIKPPDKVNGKKPPYIPSDDEEMTDDEKREAFRGALVWRQGIVWHAWKYPYEDDERDLATFYKDPPPGVVVIPGAKTAQETIQLYLGDTPPPPDRIINMGIMDINISTTQDGQLQIRYAEDAKQARGDKDAWFEGKEKKGAHTSRKKKKAEVESVSATNNDDFWSGSV